VTGAAAITLLAARVRDSGNTAATRGNLATILTHAQLVLNLHLRARLATATLTLDLGRTIYQTSEVAADVARIVRVRALDRTLPEVAWAHLVNNRRDWYRATGDQPATSARLGTTLLVITPAPWEAMDVEVVYVTVPTAVVDDATELDMPDEHMPMVLDLAEGITQLRNRQLAAMTAPLTRLASMMPQRPGAGVPRASVNV
jgi:hypothetical protein